MNDQLFQGIKQGKENLPVDASSDVNLRPLVVVVRNGVDRLLNALEIATALEVDDDGSRDGGSCNGHRST